jgi:hypothetical protein
MNFTEHGFGTSRYMYSRLRRLESIVGVEEWYCESNSYKFMFLDITDNIVLHRVSAMHPSVNHDVKTTRSNFKLSPIAFGDLDIGYPSQNPSLSKYNRQLCFLPLTPDIRVHRIISYTISLCVTDRSTHRVTSLLLMKLPVLFCDNETATTLIGYPLFLPNNVRSVH